MRRDVVVAKKTARALLKIMLEIRLVETAICNHYAEQEMRCPVHISIGQEATAAGVCLNLARSDVVLSNHRSHSHYIAKGGNLKKFIAELYGKKEGCAAGRGGSMHLIDLSVGFLGASPIVASTIPLAVGVALSLAYRKSRNIAVVFLGDAAVEEGVFHESANFAKLKNLPILFFCENNFYSVYTPLSLRQPKREITTLAAAHGLDCFLADGNDALDVYRVSKRAIAKMRMGMGPAFIEAKTYRWREHCGPNFDDHLGYRPTGELTKWQKKDPIKKLRRKLEREKLITEKALADIERTVNARITEAFAFAKSSRYPLRQELKHHLYAEEQTR